MSLSQVQLNLPGRRVNAPGMEPVAMNNQPGGDHTRTYFIGNLRFDNKVKVNPGTGCWEWQAAKRDGYGNYSVQVDGNHRNVSAHRFAYEALVGPIPEGFEIDHLCKNRSCCNPSHLEVVTGTENTRRGDSPSGLNARKTHCNQGHEYNDENCYFLPNGGGRRCRVCKLDQERIRRDKGGSRTPVSIQTKGQNTTAPQPGARQ